MDLSTLESLLESREEVLKEVTLEAVTAAVEEPDKPATRASRKLPDLIRVAKKVVTDREAIDEKLLKRDPRADTLIADIVSESAAPLVRGAVIGAEAEGPR